MQCEAAGGGRREARREGGKVTLGTEAKEKEAKFIWEEESHLEDSRADRRGGAMCHSKKRSSDRKKDKFDIGVKIEREERNRERRQFLLD